MPFRVAVTRKLPELGEQMLTEAERRGEIQVVRWPNELPPFPQELAKLIRGLHAKVNAIPLNEDANLPKWMKRPGDAAIDRFVDTLVQHDVHVTDWIDVTVRRSKGRDIAAACGQLRGKSEARSRVSRQPHLAERRVDRTGRVETAREERHVIHRERR